MSLLLKLYTLVSFLSSAKYRLCGSLLWLKIWFWSCLINWSSNWPFSNIVTALLESDKITTLPNLFSSKISKVSLMALTSAVYIDTCYGNAFFLTTSLHTAAAPTPSALFDPSVYICSESLYLLATIWIFLYTAVRACVLSGIASTHIYYRCIYCKHGFFYLP